MFSPLPAWFLDCVLDCSRSPTWRQSLVLCPWTWQSCDSFVINRVQWKWQCFLSLYPRKECSFVFLADTLFWSSELQWSPAMRLPSRRGHCKPSKEQSSCVCSHGASIMDVQLCWEFRKQQPQMTSGCDQRRASRQICSTLLSHKFTSDCFKLIHLG